MTETVIDANSRSLGFTDVVGSLETHRFIHNIDQILKDGCSCWRADSIERREGSTIEGRGLFAKEPLEPQTLVAIKGGRIVDEVTVRELTEKGVLHGSQQQIGYDRFIVGLTTNEEDLNLVGYNHSCNPNAKVCIVEGSSITLLVTRRPVQAGEEITADYSVSNMSNTHRFLCNCGAENCRKVIQPRYDCLHEDFQADYKGEFPEYIQHYIDEIAKELPEDKKWLLMSAKFGEIAGKITVLGVALKQRKQQKIPDTERSSAIQQSLLLAIVEFTSMFNKKVADECKISIKNTESFKKSVFKRIPNIIRFAKKFDEENGWNKLIS